MKAREIIVAIITKVKDELQGSPPEASPLTSLPKHRYSRAAGIQMGDVNPVFLDSRRAGMTGKSNLSTEWRTLSKLVADY